MKILLVLALIALTGQANAQQRTFYDARGNVAGRASTDSQGSTTIYDSGGKVVGRESKSGNTTTIYDAAGRNVGRVTNEKSH
jgi:YD repeat-containing protein